MKFQTLFDLLQSSEEMVSYFDKVTTPEQVVSCMERLKRRSPGDFLDSLDGLRMAIDQALNDSLEMGGALGEIGAGDELNGDELDEDELDIGKEFEESSTAPETSKPSTDDLLSVIGGGKPPASNPPSQQAVEDESPVQKKPIA
jgi:hypothetical protein